MKQRINKSLPYPLLSQDTDDYVGSTFSQSIEASRKGSNLSILLAVSLDDAAVETLLISGCATVAYHA